MYDIPPPENRQGRRPPAHRAESYTVPDDPEQGQAGNKIVWRKLARRGKLGWLCRLGACPGARHRSVRLDGNSFPGKNHLEAVTIVGQASSLPLCRGRLEAAPRLGGVPVRSFVS